MVKILKKINHRHYISILICIGLLAWSIFCCYNSYIRLFEACRDFFFSFVDLLFWQFDWCPDVTINNISSVDVVSYIPDSWFEFAENFELFWKLFWTSENFFSYLIFILPTITNIAQIVMYVILIGGIIFLINKISNKEANNNYGEFTKPYRGFMWFKAKVLNPVCKYLRELYKFFLSNKIYSLFSIIIFLLSTNICSIIISFFAYYFCFCDTFDVLSLAVQIYKLSVDMIILYNTLPLFIWLFIAWKIFDKITRSAGYKRLLRQSSSNEAVIRMLGLVNYIIARMRGGKTKLASAMAVVSAKVMRSDAMNNMLEVHSWFPNFPFELFIQDLSSQIKNKCIYSLDSTEFFISYKQKKFEQSKDISLIYNYDISNFNTSFDTGAVIISLFEALNIFAKSYLVYTEPTLFIGNYSVRELHKLTSKGNMPKWDFNLYKRPSFDVSDPSDSEYSYILDHDALRPGKKMGDDASIYGTIEYAIICEAEINKERGNKLDSDEQKKSDSSCNLKNDLFDKHLTMMGHAAMINYKCFIKMFTDGQRISGWNAAGREVSQIIEISDSSDEKLALPCFWYRDMIYRLCLSWHKSFVSSHWYYNGNRTLFCFFIDNILSVFCNYGKRIYETFGYRLTHLLLSEGTEEGEKVPVLWYSQNTLEHGGLYATDSYAQMFRQYTRRSGRGLNSFPRDRALKPSLATMRKYQHSFFMQSFASHIEEDPDEVT